jgi:Leucine-rich repeat (LRR) protein
MLEAAVRAELGLPLGFLNRIDLLRLQSLDASDLRIRDLSGLEFCTNLTFLDLSGNPISDITPLASLTNLLSLKLDSTEVFNLAALAGLINLHSLSLCSTLVTDIQALVTNSVNGGLGPGDFVNLGISSLSDQGKNVDVPFLEFVGVNVVDCG